MSDSNFIHLRLHSEYSISDGIARLAADSGRETAPMLAEKMRMESLALTDLGNIFGAIKFHSACVARGIKPIIGCDMWVGNPQAKMRPHRLLLLCRDSSGYRNLCELLTRAYRENRHRGRAELNPKWLTKTACDGLIALSGAADGEIGERLLHGETDRARDAAKRLSARFPNAFYLEVQRAGRKNDDALTAETARLAEEIGLPLAATHPIQFLQKSDFLAHEIRVCIAEGNQLDDEARPRNFTEEQHFKSAKEMQDAFSNLPGALQNAAEIAKRCNLQFKFGKVMLPAVELPANQSANSVIAENAKAGLSARLNLSDSEMAEKYQPRLKRELDVIAQMGFSDYFLIVAEFTKWARDEGIPVGPGRGSGAGSLVAYALGITDLDPIEYGLLFERFLNSERVSLPDFDIDFCQERRDEVIRHVREKYGEESVAQIVTFGAIGAKAGIRDVGRVLGMPYSRCDSIARMIPATPDITLDKAREDNKELDSLIKNEEDTRRLFSLAKRVEGIPRNVGTHAGGVLIAPGRLVEHCPLYAVADTGGLVSQFDKDDAEKIGLVKFDLLGLKTLTILDWTMRNIHALGSTPPPPPLNDAATFRIYAEADTVGIFQCESIGIRELMSKLIPDRFEDIVALMALFRPGPLGSGMVDDYIERKHKQRAISFAHPSLKETLQDTYGVIVYQEQVMQTAQLIADYTLGEADLLRRAMGKKLTAEMAKHKSRFVGGAEKKRTLSKSRAASLFETIQKFAEYGFNKSHAAAYAIISYRTAYYKAHYPSAFLAAAMSCEARNTDGIRLLIADARKRSIEVLPPDINRDGAHFFPSDSRSINYGLAAVKGVGEKAAKEIIEARGNSPFTDIFDFCMRTEGRINRTAIDALVFAGAFDSPHPNRAALIETVPSAVKSAEYAVLHRNQDSLFIGGEEEKGGGGGMTHTALVDRSPWSPEESLMNERRALGFTLRGHFFDLYRDIMRHIPATPLKNARDGNEVFVGGIIDSINTARGLRRAGFLVVTLDDTTATLEVRAGIEKVRALGDLGIGMQLLLARGRMGRGPSGEPSLRAEELFTLDDWLNQRVRRVRVLAQSGASAKEIAEMINLYRGGESDVVIEYKNGAGACEISLGEMNRLRCDSLCLRALARAPGIAEVRPELE